MDYHPTGAVPEENIRVNRFCEQIWVVEKFLDLITARETMVFDDGLRVLQSIALGAGTLNDTDLVKISNKINTMGLCGTDLQMFGETCISRNCRTYAAGLLNILTNAKNYDYHRGVIPKTYNSQQAYGRRTTYMPPVNLLKELVPSGYGVYNDDDLASAEALALVTLSQYRARQGHIPEGKRAEGLLARAVKHMCSIIDAETYAFEKNSYRNRSAKALRILLVLTKLLTGTLEPAPHDHEQLTFIDNDMSISDGTLAAIPFPRKGNIEVFLTRDRRGLTVRGAAYLAATSAIW